MNHRQRKKERQGWESERKKERQEWEIKSERERKIGRETGVREIERKTGVGERNRRSHREKDKRKIGVGGIETGMGERTIQ